MSPGQSAANMFSTWRYQSVPSSFSGEEGSELNFEKSSQLYSKPVLSRTATPWIVSTVFFAILAIYLALGGLANPAILSPGSFRTDFQAAEPWIEYEERAFTGKLSYDPVTRQPYREVDPSQPQYFGKPGPEMDAAWEDLLRNEFPTMSKSEAASFLPEFRPLPNDGKYHFELDVFHSLHCLNAVRKKLYEYTYRSPREEQNNLTTDENDWEHAHMDHCLDQIRQSIQCHGDLSPVPLYWWEGYQLALGIGQTHTCRKWEPIREWVDRRNIGLEEKKL